MCSSKIKMKPSYRVSMPIQIFHVQCLLLWYQSYHPKNVHFIICTYFALLRIHLLEFQRHTIAQNARAYVFVFKANPKMCFCTKQTTYHSCTLDANILYETLYLQGYKHVVTPTQVEIYFDIYMYIYIYTTL